MDTADSRSAKQQGEPVAWVRFADDSTRAIPVSRLWLRDFEGSVPWRKLRSRHGQQHLSGSHWVATTGGHVIYESRLELARLLLADFDPDITAIYAQPLRLVAMVDGRRRAHVPDFLLASASGMVRVVNVKPADRLAKPKIAEALAWPGALVERHGWRYEIWSGCDPVVLDNVHFLAAYRRPGIVAGEAIEQAWAAVRDGEQLAVAEHRLAVAHDQPPQAIRPALLALLWSARLVTDLTRPLSGASILRRSR
jgi:hypothetical protein